MSKKSHQISYERRAEEGSNMGIIYAIVLLEFWLKGNELLLAFKSAGWNV